MYKILQQYESAPYLQIVVKVAPDVVAQSLRSFGHLKDTHTGKHLVLLADGEGVGVDPHTIGSLEGIVYVLQVVKRPWNATSSRSFSQQTVTAWRTFEELDALCDKFLGPAVLGVAGESAYSVWRSGTICRRGEQCVHDGNTLRTGCTDDKYEFLRGVDRRHI